MLTVHARQHGIEPLEGRRLLASDWSDAAGNAEMSVSDPEIPLSFEANVGQTDDAVRFLTRGPGHTLFLTPDEAVLQFAAHGDAADPSGESPDDTSAILRMSLADGNPNPAVTGIARVSGVSNYLTGNDPDDWVTDIPHFAKVHYDEVYPGIDLEYYSSQRYLEYDFLVDPGADPSLIGLAFQNADGIHVDEEGNLIIEVAGSQVVQRAPVTYQGAGDLRQTVPSSYALRDDGTVGFVIGAYDPSRPLVIDPVLTYSTPFGGSRGDLGIEVDVDSDGYLYVAGNTGSSDFPGRQRGYDSTYNGDPPGPVFGANDVFVTKFYPGGRALVYTTYLGGNSHDEVEGMAVDYRGSVHVAGTTWSQNYPTAKAYQSHFAGGVLFEKLGDAFMTKLSPSGKGLVYSTYLGGAGDDGAFDVAVDASGNAYMAGKTRSDNFPTLAAFQSDIDAYADPPLPGTGGLSLSAFVTKFRSNGSVAYSTYFGSSTSAHGIAVDAIGNAYFTGHTEVEGVIPTTAGAHATSGSGFVAKFNQTGSTLIYSTYIVMSAPLKIAVDTLGQAHAVGIYGVDGDVGVVKVHPLGYSQLYANGFHNTGQILFPNIAIGPNGNAYVTGGTSSLNFPVRNASQATQGGGHEDAFLMQLNSSGSIVDATYLGGSLDDRGYGIIVDRFGNATVTGDTQSSNFPQMRPFSGFRGEWDAFVATFENPDPLPGYYRNTPVKKIPDLRTVSVRRYVPDSFVISDLNLVMDISHTYAADLDVYLRSPKGTRVPLFTDVGGSRNEFLGTHLDDAATRSITKGGAPFAGSYRPEGRLSRFNGQNARGWWTLTITDDNRLDTGTLRSWWLLFNTRNRAPRIQPIADQWATAGVPLSFQVQATDPDRPRQQIGFSVGSHVLGPDAPDGLRINQANGQVSWTPRPDQVGSYTFGVYAFDSADSPKFDTRRVTIRVQPGAETGIHADQIGVRRAGSFLLDFNGNGVWNTGAGGDLLYSFQRATDKPITGDWNGDGADEIGVRRGVWFFLDANGNGVWDTVAGGDFAYKFGKATDTPIAGDWNNDGTDEIGVRSGKVFRLDVSGDGVWNPARGDKAYPFGIASDKPVIGDWNGDGYDNLGVRRGNWFLLDFNGNGIWNSAATVDRKHWFGKATDKPIAGDWNGDGKDEIGVRRGTSFLLDFNGTGWWDTRAGGDVAYQFGKSSDTAVIGNWVAPIPLQVAGGPLPGSSDARVISAASVAPILQTAVDMWSAAFPLTLTQQRTLRQLTVRVDDLPGANLGHALGTTITLDLNAAGHGWFIDATPSLHEEFAPGNLSGLRASDDSPAAGRVDLLTAVLHELGHLFGFDHHGQGVMRSTLSLGTRRLVERTDGPLDDQLAVFRQLPQVNRTAIDGAFADDRRL